MENLSENNETKKADKLNFAYYSLILASTVIIGVVGHIYNSIDKPNTKSNI
jgi:hypothetical protein